MVLGHVIVYLSWSVCYRRHPENTYDAFCRTSREFILGYEGLSLYAGKLPGKLVPTNPCSCDNCVVSMGFLEVEPVRLRYWGFALFVFRAVSSGFFAVMEIWHSILYLACSGGKCNSMASGGCCIPTWAGLRMRMMRNLFIVHICTLQSQGHKEWKLHCVLKSRSCCVWALSQWWRYIKLSLHLNVW